MTSMPLRAGLMVPANNTTMEGELLDYLPPGSTCRTLRIPRGAGLLTPETIPAYRAAALRLAAELAADPPDILAYGCTAAGFISGPEGDVALAWELEKTVGCPVVTTARSMVLAVQAEGARKIAVVTPYTDAVNRQLERFFTEDGIEVRRMDSLYAADTAALGRITAEEVRDLALQTMTPDLDALFIGCSQLPTLAILDDLARHFGRPVWSSIKATAWCAMRTVTGATQPEAATAR